MSRVPYVRTSVVGPNNDGVEALPQLWFRTLSVVRQEVHNSDQWPEG
jgi:hypothetical protein